MDIFVGRSAQLHTLTETLRSALTDKSAPRIIIVEGEPGSGKTYLMREFAEAARKTVIDGDSSELWIGGGYCSDIMGDSTSFLPFYQILDSLRAQPSNSRFARFRQFDSILAELGPEWLRMLPVVGEGLAGTAHVVNRMREGQNLSRSFAPSKTPDSDIYRQYFEVMKRLAHEHKILILLDDLQWADRESLNLLLYLGRQLAEKPLPILIACALRRSQGKGGGSVGEALEPALLTLLERRHCIRIPLEALSRSEIEQLLGATHGSSSNTLHANSQLLDQIQRLTGGNPLFVTELLRDLQERGYPVGSHAGLPAVRSLDEVTNLPTSLEATIEQRLDRLETKAKELLITASVEGDIFTAQVVSQVRKRELLEVVETLSESLVQKYHLVEELEERELAFHKIASLFSFRHGLIRQHLYRGLGRAQRRILHAQIADCLAALYGDAGVQSIASQLAKHYMLAEEPEKLVKYALLAAQEEYARFAPSQALQWCDRLLAAYSRIPESSEIGHRSLVEALLLKAELHLRLGQSDEVRLVLNHLQSLSGFVLDDFDNARMWFFRGELSSTTASLGTAIDEFKVAQGLFTSGGKHTHSAITFQRLGELSAIQSRFRQAEEYWYQGIKEASVADDTMAEAMIWAEMAEFAIDEGDLEKSRTATESALRLFRAKRDERGIAVALINVGFADYIRGRTSRALASLREAWRTFLSAEDVPNLIRVGMHIANCHIDKGELASAEDVLQLLGDYCFAHEAALHEIEISISHCRLALAQGKLEKAMSYALDATSLAVEEDHYSCPRAHAVKAAVHAALAEDSAAEQHFTTALQQCHQHHYPYVTASVEFEYARFLVSSGKGGEAHDILQNARKAYLHLEAETRIYEIDLLLSKLPARPAS